MKTEWIAGLPIRRAYCCREWLICPLLPVGPCGYCGIRPLLGA